MVEERALHSSVLFEDRADKLPVRWPRLEI